MVKTIKGYPFYEDNEVIIQYSVDLIDMQNTKNNVYNLILMGYLKSRGDYSGRITTSINTIVNETGYAVKSKSKAHHKRFKDALFSFIEEGLLLVDESLDFEKLKYSTFFDITINRDNDIFAVENRFEVITMEDFKRITSFAESSVKPGVLLNLYLLMKKYSFSDQRNQLIYPTKTTLTKQLGFLSPKTTEKAISSLIDLGLLYKDKAYFMKNTSGEDNYVQLRPVYALDPENFKYTRHALKEMYETQEIYSVSEIDTEKIARLSKKQ